jgi:hypothetical protein
VRSPYTPGIARAVRANLAPILAHTYERTPTTGAAADLWARRVKTPGTPVERVPCRYIPRTVLTTTAGGYVLATEPPAHGGSVNYLQTLTVAHDDPLVVGDQVGDIRDSEGVLLLAGPAVVEADMPHAGGGPLTLRMLVLRGETVERNG